MAPPSGWCTPKIRLHSVDLPAPFSPRMQWISPGRMSSDTSDSAVKLPNRFVIADSDRSGSTDVSAAAEVMVIAKALALQHRDLAGHDVLHDRIQLCLLLGRAATDHHAGGFRTHLE